MEYFMCPKFDDLKDPIVMYVAIQAFMHEVCGGEDFFDQTEHKYPKELLNEFMDYLIEKHCLKPGDKEIINSKDLENIEYIGFCGISYLLENRYTEEETDNNWEEVRDKATRIYDKVYYFFANFICKKDEKMLLKFQDILHSYARCQWKAKDWLYWTNEYYMLKNTQIMEEDIG